MSRMICPEGIAKVEKNTGGRMSRVVGIRYAARVVPGRASSNRKPLHLAYYWSTTQILRSLVDGSLSQWERVRVGSMPPP
jgi:hypothetical protein